MKSKLVGESWINSPEKRRQDIIIAASLAPFVLPVGGFSMIAASLEDGKKPLFRQSRIGQAGEPFGIFKIRTMPSSEYFDRSRGSGDPRATRVGKVLRKFSFDELPQILNILGGNMAVVGPRPLIQPDIEAMRQHLAGSEFNDWFRAYSLGRPGWVSRFGNLSRRGILLPHSETAENTYRTRAELDIEYMELASKEFDRQVIGDTLHVALELLSPNSHSVGQNPA